MESISLQTNPDGSVFIYAPFSACELPQVGLSDIDHAWKTASLSVEMDRKLPLSAPEGVIFQNKSGSIVQVKFDDFDALFWINAIHNSAFNLTTIKGLSVCFRMLALYHLMAESKWARALFSFDRRNRLRIDKTLIAAAATAPLNINGLFDSKEIMRETGANFKDTDVTENYPCNANATTDQR